MTLLSLVNPAVISEEQKLFLQTLKSRNPFVIFALRHIETNSGSPLWETEWQGESIGLRRDVIPSASSEKVRYFLDFRGVNIEARRLPSAPHAQRKLQPFPHRLLSPTRESLFFTLDPRTFSESDFQALAECLQKNTTVINRALQNVPTSHPENRPELGGLAFAPPGTLQEVFVRNPQERIVIEWDGTVNLVRQTIDNKRESISVGEISSGSAEPALRLFQPIDLKRYRNENNQTPDQIYQIEDEEEG